MCRILLDIPDIGTWHKSALQILPRYPAVTAQLLKQDVESPDQERMYRALRWRTELGLDPPYVSGKQPQGSRAALAGQGNQSARAGFSDRPHIVGQPLNSASTYRGPMSGTFECRGDPIPQGGEYVFLNIPQAHLMLDFDTKKWEARLAPGEGQTQVLVLKNKGNRTEKKCAVHWSVVQ